MLHLKERGLSFREIGLILEMNHNVASRAFQRTERRICAAQSLCMDRSRRRDAFRFRSLAHSQVLALPIDEMRLSARATTSLRKAGIKTLGELIPYSRSRFQRWKLAGETSLDEIEAELAIFGLALTPEPSETTDKQQDPA